ncbi:hypothetical protein A9Q84_06575 [Halobacteriovorax marinus]|uniref:Response regulatory domain-containing protein n=1 Tax=Halobacteriovorax marinus TaxID=97084 RepID=A0A1Y5FA08_9BACT|nr:hypothetical protein A9Q84_06575 [Halobacteriovorax marinus]
MSKLILVVEDCDDDYEVLSESFKEVEIINELVRCKDGQEALDYLNKNGRQGNPKRPDLILLDLNMPGIDGREVLRIVKSDFELQSIPVFILTTSESERDVEDCYKFGANSYIPKPADFDGFIEALKVMKGFVFELSLLPKNT